MDTLDVSDEESARRVPGALLQREESADLLCHLLKLAHQFEVRGLVERCSMKLKGGLDAGSAVERLMFADELGLKDLHSACVNFLTSIGNLAAAQATEAWARSWSSGRGL